MTDTQTDAFLDDFAAPTEHEAQGKPLPMGRTYAGTLASEVKQHDSYRYGEASFVLSDIEDVATGGKEFADGNGLYKIGSRKVFHRIGLGWISDDEEKVATVNRIAKDQLYKLAWAAGLATKEKVDGKWRVTLSGGVSNPETLVELLNGKRMEFQVKHRTYTDRLGVEQVDAQPGWFAPLGGK